MKKIKFKKIFYWFTLVELIIVITIISILATIAFISFSWYNKKSRDSNRLTSTKQIETWLDLFSINVWKYPDPDWNILNWNMSWVTIMKTWEIWENISQLIKINNIPKDPLTNKPYKYWVTIDNKEFNIWWVFESEVSKINIINKTYADDLKAKLLWNYKWYINYKIWEKVYLTNIPSLIYTYSWEINDIYNQKDKINFLINNYYNLEDQTKNTKLNTDEIIRKKTWNEKSKLENIEISDIIKNPNKKDIIIQKYWEWEELNNVMASFWVWKLENFEQIISWSNSIPQNLSQYNCWETKNWLSKMFWKKSSVNYWETCEPWINFMCKNWKWFNETYNKNDYLSEVECVVWNAKSCLNKNINWYELITKNHSESQTWSKIDQTFINWTKYITQNYICNNWEFETNSLENEEIKTCDVDYYLNNQTCDKVDIWFYSEWNSLDKKECTNKPLNSIYISSWNGLNNCNYTCNEWYSWTSCNPKEKSISTVSYNSKNYSFTTFNLLYWNNIEKTSLWLPVSWWNYFLKATFNLGSNWETVTLNNITEELVCNSWYYKNGNTCIVQWSWNQTSWYIFKNESWTITYPTSCNNLLTSNTWKNNYDWSPWNGTKFNDWYYFIKPDSTAAFSVYCDMTNDWWGWTRYLNIKANYTFQDSKDCWAWTKINNSSLDCFNPNRFNMTVWKFMVKTPRHATKKISYYSPWSAVSPNVNQYSSYWTERKCLWNNSYMTLMSYYSNSTVTYANTTHIRLWLNFCWVDAIKWRNVWWTANTQYMNYAFEWKTWPVWDRENSVRLSEVFIK